MSDVSILDKGVSAVPKQYTIAGAQEIVLKGVTAAFDGSGAGGNWIPALQVVDPSGFVVGTYTLGSTLAAGASADVSWFPSGAIGGGGSGGSGIAFDTDNQGGWLSVTTNDRDPSSGLGMQLLDASGFGINVESDGAAGVIVTATGAGGANLFSTDVAGNEAQVAVTAANIQLLSIGSPASISLIPDGTATGDGTINIGGGNHGNTQIFSGAVDGDVQVTSNKGKVVIQADTFLQIDLGALGSKYIQTTNLTTVNPGGSGRIWNNAGVLNIT